MTAPNVFVSYSHDSDDHKSWVLKLAKDLRDNGVDATLDQWDLPLGGDLATFMERGVAAADRVILVCTKQYVDKADGGVGGVAYEKLVVTGELVDHIDTKKFIPLMRQSLTSRRMPRYLGVRRYIDFSDDTAYAVCLEELLREIHGVPGNPKPPLGPNPFAATTPSPAPPARIVGPSGFTGTGSPVLDDAWFAANQALATEGLQRLGRNGLMEVRSALHEPVAKSQLELLNSVRSSQITTFGWPIAIFMTKEEFKPRPQPDGIVAEVSITEKGLSGSTSYDRWAARSNGDFYLLQSLFEDERAENALFFNTRIVRVAESLLFLSKYYDSLGVPSDVRVSVRVTHGGMSGRTLTSVGGRRHIFASVSVADRSESQVDDSVGGLSSNAAEHVRKLLEPLFMLFDFATFDKSVYADIVERFGRGEVT
jgi:hypothetical protein